MTVLPNGDRSRLGGFGLYDVASSVLLAALLALALLTFRDYSISNDEFVQHRYGEMILAYYTSGLADRSLFDFGNLYLYGGLFDVIAILLGHVVGPLLHGDIYAIRHLLCAVIGIGGLAAAWATARMIAGPRAGALALLSLAVCGVWYGAMFNHTKDVPFAAAMIGASYFLLRAVRELPHPRLRDLLLFGLMLGAALGQRALGLIVLAYVPLAIALHAPLPPSPTTALRFVGTTLMRFMPALALAYLIMIAAWPWAALSPLNPVRGLFAFSHFHYPIRTLLFGSTHLMAEVPRVYVPVYLGIKLPLAMLLGAALALLAIGAARGTDRAHDRRRICETIVIAVTAALPVLLHVAGHGPAFSGMRHFLFVTPPLAVLAGIGFDRGLAAIEARSRVLARLMLPVLGAWFVFTASVLVRLHPYEHLYFNEMVGGLAGADQRFDTDYWVNVMHEAMTGLAQVLDREKSPHLPYHVAVCSEAAQFGHDAAARQDLQLAVGPMPADFFIAPTHMHCDGALDGKVIVRIERMGTLIGVVKDRREQTRGVAQAR